VVLEAGTRFGAYAVAEPIGAGGMGEVYRATDTELKRDVALKVLPQAFVEDADRLARFRREGEILASLNHSNIAQVYGLERSDGRTAIVMELVEGPTLADRIMEGPIPPDEAMGIALQIVAALEAAHEKQIVHRDLKPANIKIRNDGTVKVLDFGISKPIDPQAVSGTPVMTTPAVTQTGVILGTAAYMSPEQARGKPVDTRTDIWAFGCVLYEMLTGQPAFGGEDVMLTLARVLSNDTDIDSLPGTISPAVRQTIRLCLEKDPRRRIADIRDVRLALEGAFDVGTRAAMAQVTAPAGMSRRLLPVAAVLVTALVTGLAVWGLTRPGAPDIERFDLTLGNQTISTVSPSVAIAPDGKSIAYLAGGERSAGGAELRVRRLDRLDADVVATGDAIASPFFSPDGLQIGYYMNVEPPRLERVSIQGGAPVTITTIPSPLRGASWGEDGTIVYATSDTASGLLRVSALGGEPEVLTLPADGEEDHHWPEILPGGEAVLFTIVGPAGTTDSQIAALSLASGERRILIPGGAYPRYSPSGHIIYSRDGALWAVPFDPRALETRGAPVPVQQGLLTKNTRGGSTSTDFGLAANGTLVYVTGDVAGNERGLVWVDAAGRTETALAPRGQIDSVALSPDGTRAAIAEFASGNGVDLSIVDLVRRSVLPLMNTSGDNRNVIFTPDGQRIVYDAADRDGGVELFSLSADGRGDVERLAVFEPPIYRVIPTSWSPDGTLLFVTLLDRSSFTIGALTIGDPDSFQPIGPPTALRRGAALSPDGRWLAYDSRVGGVDEVYVEGFPGGGGRQPVSIGGGRFPKWDADGRSLTYLNWTRGDEPVAVMRVSVAGGEALDQPLTLSEPTELFPWSFYLIGNSHSYFDMAADGERFLMITSSEADGAAQVFRTILVQNWLGELERLAPVD